MTTHDRQQPSRRIEVLVTPEERELIDRAVAALGTDLTSFVIDNLTVAAQRVLAARTVVVLDAEARRAWEEINARPALDVAGLRELVDRPSPFIDG